jgi:uncharacterized protein
MADASSDARDDETADRFVVEEDGVEAELVYALRSGRLMLIHTDVPDEVAGRGIGGRLVRAAIARARAGHLTIVPWCPFARQWLADHPDVARDVSIDWDSLPPGGG